MRLGGHFNVGSCPLADQLGPDLALLVGERHRGTGAVLAGRFLHRAVNLADPAMPSRSTVRLPISAGKGLANPIAMLASFAIALRYSFANGGARPISSIRRS